MSRSTLPLLLLLAFTLRATPARAGDEVTFIYSPPKSGDVLQGTESMKLEFDVKVAMGELELGAVHTVQHESEELTATLVTWTAKKREATLAFGRNETTEATTNPGGGTETTSESKAHAGKSYRVVAEGEDAPTVTRLGKGEVSEEERALVLEAFTELPREPGPLEEALRARTLRVGDEITADPKVAQELLEFGEDDTFRLTQARVVLRELKQIGGEQCGVLQIEVTMVAEEEGMSMSMTATGEAALSVTGMRPHLLSLKGPLTLIGRMEQEGMVMTMSGGGAFEAGAGWTYRTAK